MGEQTLEFELSTCINMLKKEKKKKKNIQHVETLLQAITSDSNVQLQVDRK